MTKNTTTSPIGLLTGKVLFITGASRGIGAAAARLFAREGAAVVLAARSTDALDRIVTEIRADGGVADIDRLQRRVTELEQHVAEQRQQLAERNDELEAARAANRDLMTHLNRPIPRD
jgi:NAD(P)-dependent dehydrogenase (short-subunit alcohol dehydrogenase family)